MATASVSVTVDAGALGVIAQRARSAAAKVDPSSPEGAAMFETAAEILVGEVRVTIMEGYRGKSAAVVRTGNLARSFRKEVTVSQGAVTLAAKSDSIYAKIQDQGGRIFPRTRKALAVPLIRLPVGKWPRHWSRGELFAIRKAGSVEGVLARKRGRTIEAVYALRKSVKIEPKHYLRKASKEALPRIGKYITREVMKGVTGGK